MGASRSLESPVALPLLSLSLLLLVLGVPEAAAQGCTLFVATNGSDATGSGSAVSPFATITAALAAAPDGSVICVRPGDYLGRVRVDAAFASGVTVRSEVPYQARLRNNDTVVTCFGGQGITLEGFDIAHSGPGAGGLVILAQTDPATAIGANATPTFSVFATATQVNPFDPATNRIFLRFRDAGGVVRGATSVAVRTQ